MGLIVAYKCQESAAGPAEGSSNSSTCYASVWLYSRFEAFMSLGQASMIGERSQDVSF